MPGAPARAVPVRPACVARSGPSLLGRLVLLCVGLRVGLEAIGLASLAVHDQPVWTNALDLWNRWDAHHYLRLAEVGYVQSSPPPNTDDPLYIVFFPFFPLAVHIVSLAVQNLVLSALVVSFAASVGAGYFLFRLVALDANEATAWRAVLLLFSFPTAYYLAAPFSEALFLLARRAGVRDRVRRLAWISLTAAGLLTYLAINQIVHGDPLYFLEVQRTHWFQGLTPPWEPVRVAIESLVAGGNDFTFTFIYAGRIAGVLVTLPLLVLAVRRLRLPDVLYGWAGFVLVLSAAWLISLPRYLLILYPLFVVGARLGRSPRVLIPLVVAGAALQGWLMWQYSAGQWTF